MSGYLQQAATPLATNIPAWLHAYNQRGVAQLAKHSFPGRKTESWKYTNLRALEQGDYHSAPLTVAEEESWKNIYAIPNLNAVQIVFVNGVFSERLSSDVDCLPEGVELSCFSSSNEAQQTQIESMLDSLTVADKQIFSALNSAQLSEGVFFKVAKNVHVKQPVQVVNLSTSQSHAFTVNQRLLVVLEQGSEATIVEHFATLDNDQPDSTVGFTNSVTELCIAENARLHHYRLQLEDESAIHIGSVNVGLQRNANLHSFHLGLGGKIKRVDITVNHCGEGAHSDLNGVYLTRNKQHIDYHTCIEHRVPNCTSNESFRGIIADSSRAVFNGRIHIHPDAQKTLAQLSNKNLLTSNKAEVDTKPELEIYADDVQCAHGATVAQLDNTAMHYLLTRGVGAEEAKVMLSFGFINELINDIRDDAVACYLRPLLTGMFSKDEQLVRHLG